MTAKSFNRTKSGPRRARYCRRCARPRTRSNFVQPALISPICVEEARLVRAPRPTREPRPPGRLVVLGLAPPSFFLFPGPRLVLAQPDLVEHEEEDGAQAEGDQAEADDVAHEPRPGEPADHAHQHQGDGRSVRPDPLAA